MLRTTVLLCCLVGIALGDTIANCTFDDAQGVWNFVESARTGDNTIDCSSWSGNGGTELQFDLKYPNKVVDQYGNVGHWTLIYNQGFEVNINLRKYFVYFWYDAKTYDCTKTMPGWSHDVTIRNWACIKGTKKQNSLPQRFEEPLGERLTEEQLGGRFKNDETLIRRINLHQRSWEATSYPQFEEMTHGDMLRMRGGRKSRIHNRPFPVRPNSTIAKLVDKLPVEFDWRAVNGASYVSPVRNQGGCGSCYSFSSMGMLEARIRVATDNREQPVFSPQDVVSCSQYSQGCEGGFPYLIAGKYAQDFGVVPEECNPYRGQDSKTCDTKKNCTRTYTFAYRYVGGYYGACNEQLMKLALVNHGPLSVSFEVYPDFQQYKGGIYHHTGLQSGFNPFELTNHAVLLVGYGVDKDTSEKYWIVKNSWGEAWGEKGYFRIRRGTDECAIESIAVEAFPIP